MKKLVCVSALLLAACATPAPTGPGILVLPGTGKTFDQFRADDQDCRGFAYNQIGGKSAEQASQDSATKSAVVGTAVGTAAGALLGTQGAAVGAGVGLAGGSIVGSDTSRATAGSQQQRYDHAFTQCMYAKGHKVPVTGRYSDARSSTSQQAARQPPPPPPGKPPADVPPDYKQQ